MVKEKVLTQKHHRRPRSNGGTSKLSNISNVKGRLHKAWHVLVGNMNAYQIRDFLNSLSKEFKPENMKVSCRFINGSQLKGHGEPGSINRHKISMAWLVLFEGLTFREIINYVNNVWLDPSYHFYIIEKHA